MFIYIHNFSIIKINFVYYYQLFQILGIVLYIEYDDHTIYTRPSIYKFLCFKNKLYIMNAILGFIKYM